MNNTFENDFEEIIETIVAYPYEKSNEADVCLNKLTEKTQEEYLNRRAEYIRGHVQEISVSGPLALAASLCIEEKCKDCPIKKYCNHYINTKRSSVKEYSLRMVDLFCGAGGLSLGFTEEGFITSLANDIEPCCIDTYAHNHPETPRSRIILGDIKDLAENINEILNSEKVDIIVGGPPCQGFSMANRQRLIDDPRNRLYRNYVKIVDKVKPPFFVMENVKGMLSVAQQVIEDFNKIGYEVSARVLNAKDFGVPQNRERLIYIGNRIGKNNEQIFDEIIEYGKKIPEYTLGSAIYGLPELKASRVKNATDKGSKESGARISKSDNKENDYINLINQGRKIKVLLNHKARYNNDRDIEIFGRMNPGDNSNDPKIADIMPYASRNDIFKDKYFKLDNSKVCKTITAHMKFDCNMYIHPAQARGLTPREAARVQSYPDDYFFRGSYTKTFMQIGNSVPPLLGRAIANVIKNYL